MEIRNSFEVVLPPDEAMAVLMDVERVVPCLPGAELVEIVDDRTFKGKVSVRLGPVSLSFNGTAKFEEIDAAGHTAAIVASGQDEKGRGNASAKANFSVEETGLGSRVDILTDLKLAGAVAQYGRGTGMITDLATQIIGQFADNLNAQISASAGGSGEAAADGTSNEERPAAASQKAKPIKALPLLASAFWNAIKRLFGRG